MSMAWEPSNILNGREVLVGDENALDPTIEANDAVKRSMRLNLRRYLFRRAARRYGFYRAYLAAEKGYAEACKESEERARTEGLGDNVMRSGLIGDIKATVLFCIAALAAIYALEGLR